MSDTNQNLLLALLSMDAYYRELNSKLTLSVGSDDRAKSEDQ
jgi:hypothetical protein